jgi:hypothetical protein
MPIATIQPPKQLSTALLIIAFIFSAQRSMRLLNPRSDLRFDTGCPISDML